MLFVVNRVGWTRVGSHESESAFWHGGMGKNPAVDRPLQEQAKRPQRYLVNATPSMINQLSLKAHNKIRQRNGNQNVVSL